MILTTTNPFDSIATAVTTALTTVKTDAFDLMGDVAPAALAIMGAVLTIRIAIRTFKSIAGR